MAEGRAPVTDGYLENLVRLLASIQVEQVQEMGAYLGSTRAKKGIVWVLGNGGSDSNAGHMVLHLRDRGQQAHDLMAESASLTALSNDHSYGGAPMRLLRNMGKAEDALLVLSGSGDSVNILAALAEARRIGMRTLGLLGFGGGAAKGLCDCAIVSEGMDYGPVEDVHSALVHMLTIAPIDKS